MLDVLNISIPFFALIFLVGAHATGFIDVAGTRTMSNLLLRPCRPLCF